jgi:hypothetical protein
MKYVILGAAALTASVLAASALVTPASAQAVISDPGRCAQFYPNANCQNYGPGNPYTGRYVAGRYQLNGFDRDSGFGDHYAYMRHHRMHRHYRRHH